MATRLNDSQFKEKCQEAIKTLYGDDYDGPWTYATVQSYIIEDGHVAGIARVRKFVGDIWDERKKEEREAKQYEEEAKAEVARKIDEGTPPPDALCTLKNRMLSCPGVYLSDVMLALKACGIPETKSNIERAAIHVENIASGWAKAILQDYDKEEWESWLGDLPVSRKNVIK